VSFVVKQCMKMCYANNNNVHTKWHCIMNNNNVTGHVRGNLFQGKHLTGSPPHVNSSFTKEKYY